MRWLVRLVPLVYLICLIVGFGYWWYVWQMHDGMPPPDEALGHWAIANPWAFERSFYLVAVQPSYLIFWWLTRKTPRTGLGSALHTAQLILVFSLIAFFLILLLATPDVSGFTS